MPRNGSGTYTVPITYTPNTLASAADVNSNFTDVATAMTGSLPRDGQAGMVGPLRVADGTLSAPGLAFNNDTDSGIRRTATGFALVVGGVDVLAFSATEIAFSIAAVSGLAAVVPVGMLAPYAGSSAPTQWLLCYGQAISRTTYSALFAAIGTNYGSGDGSTTFNLPDLRGRTPAGLDNMGGSAASRLTGTTMTPNGNTIGATGGTQTHTLTGDQIPANIPNSASSSSSSSTIAPPGNAIMLTQGSSIVAGSGGTGILLPTGSVSGLTTTTSTSTSVTINPGGGGAHLNVQPTQLTNFIIYAGA